MLEELVPILYVRDGQLSAGWYARLGFAVEGEHRFAPGLPLYLFLRRGTSALHLSEHRGDAQPGTLLYFYVRDVEEIALEFNATIEDQPWAREVQLTDPDGNRLRIGERKEPGGSASVQPDGWHAVTPRIVTNSPDELVQFLKDVFGASGEFRSERPTEMRIGDSVIMVSGDAGRRPMPAFLYVYVEDADATYARAVDSGATPLEEPADTPYGDRRGMVRDAWGNTWQIATRRR